MKLLLSRGPQAARERVGDGPPAGYQPARLVPAVALLWLAFLAYPLVKLAQAPPPPARLVPALAAAALLVGLYLAEAWRVARDPHARPGWVAIAAICALGLGLPLVAGPAWHGYLLYAALLAGFTLPAGPALLAALAFAGLTAATGPLAGVPPAQLAVASLAAALAGAVAAGVRLLVAVSQALLTAREEVERLAATEERLRLARERQHAARQQVLAAAVEVGTARALVAGGDPPGAARHLDEASAALRKAQQELTGAIDQARPVSLDGRELAEALSDHVVAWSRRSGIQADLRLCGRQPIPPAVGEALFRAAEEALANAARHSGASRVGIELESGDETVALTIVDDGQGFGAGAVGRAGGLERTRERLELVGGSLTVASRPGAGTRVTCVCPRRPRASGSGGAVAGQAEPSA